MARDEAREDARTDAQNEPERALEETDDGSSSPIDLSLVEDLVAEVIDGRQLGDDRLESLCRTHPEAAEALREGVADLEAMGFVAATPARSVEAAEAPKSIGRYTVHGELGRGGMGIVHLARDPRLGRFVAIKRLPEQLIDHPDALARFQREARLLAALDHPNIGAIYSLEDDAVGPFLTSREEETL